MNLNTSAFALCELAAQEASLLRIEPHASPEGGQILDFGCHCAGGLRAGSLLAKICLAGLAEVEIVPGHPSLWSGPVVQVTSDFPIEACMGSQYAGWKISHGDFFAMGSGPMRVRRGREPVLEALKIEDGTSMGLGGPMVAGASRVVGVLECDALPGPDVIRGIAEQCGTTSEHVTLCVAPTRSLAGVIQVVARSIETALHKWFELGFDLRSIRSAHGVAPLPPIAVDFAEGIGRTNDAILYGGQVTLWVDCEDAVAQAAGPRIPSAASRDFGKPFAQTFRDYGYDFYQVDPGLFAPAEVVLVNLRTGRSFRYGGCRPDILATSFGESSWNKLSGVESFTSGESTP